MYLEVKDVKKSYGSDAGYTQVLKGVTTSVEKGEMCVIQGTSGSGKSTLLNCIGGLDIMDSGSVKVDGTEIFGLKADALAKYRKANLGFILVFFTARFSDGNTALPCDICRCHSSRDSGDSKCACYKQTSFRTGAVAYEKRAERKEYQPYGDKERRLCKKVQNTSASA